MTKRLLKNRFEVVVILSAFISIALLFFGCAAEMNSQFDSGRIQGRIQNLERLADSEPLPSPPKDEVMEKPAPVFLEAGRPYSPSEPMIGYPVSEHDKITARLLKMKQYRDYAASLRARAALEQLARRKAIDLAVNEARKGGELERIAYELKRELDKERRKAFWRGVADKALLGIFALLSVFP